MKDWGAEISLTLLACVRQLLRERMELLIRCRLAPMLDMDVLLFGLQRTHRFIGQLELLTTAAVDELLGLIHSEACWPAPLSAPQPASTGHGIRLDIFTTSFENWARLSPLLQAWADSCSVHIQLLRSTSNSVALATLPAASVVRELTEGIPTNQSRCASNSIAEEVASSLFRAAVGTHVKQWHQPPAQAAPPDECDLSAEAPRDWLARLQNPDSTQAVQAAVGGHLQALVSHPWAVQWVLQSAALASQVHCPACIVFALHSVPTAPKHQKHLGRLACVSVHFYRSESTLHWPLTHVLRARLRGTLPASSAAGTPSAPIRETHQVQECGHIPVLPVHPATAHSVRAVDAGALSLLLLGTLLWGAADAPCTHVQANLVAPIQALHAQLGQAYTAAAASGAGGWSLASMLQAALLGKVAASLISGPSQGGGAASADLSVSVWILLGMCVYCCWVEFSLGTWQPFGCRLSEQCPTSMHSGLALHVAMVLVLVLAAWLVLLQRVLLRLRCRHVQRNPQANTHALSLRHAVKECGQHLLASKCGIGSAFVLALGAASIGTDANALAAAGCMACVLRLLSVSAD